MRHIAWWSWMIAVLTLGAARSALAQSPDDPTFDPRAVGLDPTPLSIDRLGLTMHYPLGALVVPTVTPAHVEVAMQDSATPPLWEMRIQQMTLGELDTADAKGVATFLQRRFQRDDPGAKVLRNEPIALGARVGHLLAIESGEGVGGFLIVGTGENRYLVFRLTCLATEFSRVFQVIEHSFRTVRVVSTEELRATRQKQERLGAELISRLSADHLRKLVAPEQWYRIYRPGAAGDSTQDAEVGFYRVTVREGRRGEVNPSREPARYTPSEQELGLLVLVDARYLANVERGLIVDSQIRFWLNWDRTEETWSAVATQRQGEASRTEGEHGVRTPPALGYSKLKIIKNGVQTRARNEFEYVVEEPYLSQAEVYLLGSLLPRDGSIVGEMAFRYHEASLEEAEALPMRIDSWKPASDGTGNWVLQSRLLPDLPPITAVYDRNGRLIRRTKTDGTVTEPIEPQRLLDLWRRKGLPTGGRS